MVDLNVVRKGRSVWPWIAGVAALLLVIWGVAAMMNDGAAPIDQVAATSGTTPTTEPRVASAEASVPPAVAAYLTFAKAPVPAEITPNHDYAADGIRQLATALETIAETDPMRQRIQTFRAAADRIQQNPQSLQHADDVRGVFIAAADVLASVQQSRFPTADGLRRQIGEVQTLAEAVTSNQPLLQQTDRVKAFFDRAADVIRTLSSRDAPK